MNKQETDQVITVEEQPDLPHIIGEMIEESVKRGKLGANPTVYLIAKRAAMVAQKEIDRLEGDNRCAGQVIDGIYDILDAAGIPGMCAIEKAENAATLTLQLHQSEKKAAVLREALERIKLECEAVQPCETDLFKDLTEWDLYDIARTALTNQPYTGEGE